MSDDQRKRRFPGTGLVPVEQLSRSTGVDEAALSALIVSGSLPGRVDEYGAAVGIDDDDLPSAEALRGRGLQVYDDYRPDDLRSHEDTGDPDTEVDSGEDSGEASGPTWHISW